MWRLGVLGVVWDRFNLFRMNKSGVWKSWKFGRKHMKILFLLVYYFQCLWHTSYAGRLTQNGTEMECRLRTKINSGCWEAPKFCTCKRRSNTFFPEKIPTQIDIKKVETLFFSWAREDDEIKNWRIMILMIVMAMSNDNKWCWWYLMMV